MRASPYVFAAHTASTGASGCAIDSRTHAQHPHARPHTLGGATASPYVSTKACQAETSPRRPRVLAVVELSLRRDRLYSL
jgi:hypothetical protein